MLKRGNGQRRVVMAGEAVGDQFEAVADFITVSTELQRGQNVPFTLTVPLRSPQGSSLDIDKPGVYPLLVNANGTPDYGAPARLDDPMADPGENDYRRPDQLCL